MKCKYCKSLNTKVFCIANTRSFYKCEDCKQTFSADEDYHNENTERRIET